MAEGSWVGLDVHARTTLAGVLDAASGELHAQRVSPRSEETVAWLQSLPRPVRVAYEAGPTGYGLARACAASEIACTVAAPSKIPRAAGDRVKTDRRDAERLARLLRLGELVAVRVPSPDEEAARDLVRAREDARGDLMRARHRLSKLLLRHGLVYEGSAWTLAHDAWLRRQRFASRPLSLAFDECHGSVVQAKGRRDALDQAIAELAGEAPFADVVSRLVCLRGVSTLTALALTVELGDWQRFRPQSLGPFLGLVPSEHPPASGAARVRSRRRATRTRAACSSRPPGTSAGLCARAPRSSDEGSDSPRRCGRVPMRAPAVSTVAGTRSRRAASDARSWPWPSRASSRATAGRWRRWSSRRSSPARRGERTGARTRGAIRGTTTSSRLGHARP
jgi:transposase